MMELIKDISKINILIGENGIGKTKMAKELAKKYDGLVFDNFEFNLHYSVMPRFFEWLLDLADQNNKKLFLVTHSKEAIEYLYASAKKHNNHEDITVFRIIENIIKEQDDRSENLDLNTITADNIDDLDN